jgi:ABC-type nitrate/sulfonate/bicarbonate transport system substrate-binding protein
LDEGGGKVKRRHVRLLALVAVLALVGAACSDDDDGGEGGGGATSATGATGGEPDVVTHAAGSTADAYIPQYRAPQIFGDQFGISTDEHIQLFEEGSLAAQLVASGDADVGSGGFTNMVQLLETGQDVKVFCPTQKDSTEHLVGRTEAITSLEQITDPDVRVAVESAGGFLNLLMNLVFLNRGLGITTDDLTNTVILEDGSLRLAAMAAGDVDVASLDLFEQADLKEELGEDAVEVLSVVAEDAEFLSNVLWARTDWLEENADLAARYCATVLFSNRQMASDYEQYKAALEEFSATGIEDEAVVQANWDFARQYEVWPYNTTVLTPEVIADQLQVSVDTGIIEPETGDLSFEDLVDTEILAAAQEYLGGEVTAADIESGDIPEPNV